MPDVILAVDQGTTSCRAILFDTSGQPLVTHAREFPQRYPQPGWVEHRPEDIWNTQVEVIRQTLQSGIGSLSDIVAIGIANQRETTVLWDKRTGQSVHNAIVWQDRRTAGICDQLRRDGWEPAIREKTGLVVDPYFSGTKLRWLLDNVDGLGDRAERGEIAFGTVDSYLLYQLSGGALHVTDYTNACRTMLFNINTLDWDDDILRELAIPRAMLPEVRTSSEVYGCTDTRLFGREIPIAGIAGDQQAATFGQACFQPGMAKQTYGTGSFMLMNVGDSPVPSESGLLTTIAWGIGDEITYALEGAIFVTGAAVQWLRDELGIIETAAETESLATSVESTGGAYLVPAFAGLGAPYWDPYARGTLVGLTRGTGKAEIARATLESAAYQTRDVLDAMRADAGVDVQQLRVDGGMVANDFLLQFQADMLDRPVERPEVAETTALGAAYLAGLGIGFWRNQDEISHNWRLGRRFEPAMGPSRRDSRYRNWRRAVERSRSWIEPDTPEE